MMKKNKYVQAPEYVDMSTSCLEIIEQMQKLVEKYGPSVEICKEQDAWTDNYENNVYYTTAVIDQLRERVAELEESNRSWVLRIQQRDIEMDEMSQLIEAQAEELAAIMEQSTARAERILRSEDELAKLREGQEPVAWVDRDGSGHDIKWYKADIDRLPDGTKLYASPVTKAVVMPERKELSIYADEEFYRWLEQLPDAYAR